MAETMEASVKKITDGQIEDAVAKFRDALRTHRSELLREPTQLVLGTPNIGMGLLVPFRARVEVACGIIIRRVKVDRSRSPHEVIRATGRTGYIDEKVLATMPKGEGDEVDAWFVPTKRRIHVHEVPAFLAEWGLVEDPRAQAAVNEEDPAFADSHSNGSQWGDNCYLMFDRWDGDRCVDVRRRDDGWHASWFLSGVPAPRK